MPRCCLRSRLTWPSLFPRLVLIRSAGLRRHRSFPPLSRQLLYRRLNPLNRHVPYRRLQAALLLVLFCLSLLSPLFGAAGRTNLPACCRRAGQHHCAGSQVPPSGRVLQNDARCPLYPGIAPGAVQVFAGIFPAATVAARFRACVAARDSYARLRASSRIDRAYSKRGPPSSSSISPG
jgi:hypothetical protein